jgi:glycosyltransferase involved in cell wall biosynthesis
MKVAIIHDYLNQSGGAERVLESFMELFPDAPVYTIISDLPRMSSAIQAADVRHSFIQSIPFSKKHYKKMLGLFPMAVEQFDLREYDLVLSSSSAFAKGVITYPHQLHICYCYTPMRYVWDLYHQYIQEDVRSPIYRFLLPFMLHRIRMWDQLNSQRVHHFIADSINVSNRIQNYYGRNSTVICPPVNFNQFNVADTLEDYFLIVSRLIPYKRISIAIEAFNKLKWPLVIIGDGYDRKRLEALAGPTIRFLGQQPDEVIVEYYSKCQAFILAGEEDFGITPLEAQASGRPVIAYRKGGALETVIERETGLFFEEQTADSLIEVLISFQNYEFVPARIREHAFTFGKDRFKQEISAFIRTKCTQKGVQYETEKR